MWCFDKTAIASISRHIVPLTMFLGNSNRKLFPFGATNPSVTSGYWREWSIGIYAGVSPLELSPMAKSVNPVLTREACPDIGAEFVADPFMIKHHGIWHMFFEFMERETQRGKIALATSEDMRKWTFRQVVLEEPFHVSYPYVFTMDNEFYMIPETCAVKAVRLYKATDFPAKWSFVGTLLEGREFADPSVFYFNNRWWLFTGQRLSAVDDTLRLYHAEKLTGPWFEHPKSPILEGNRRAARPAGRVLVIGDRIIRYAQDCYPAYGAQVRAFEVVELTTENYSEIEIEGKSPILAGSGRGWNAAGMHHVDAHRVDDGTWVACVDGFPAFIPPGPSLHRRIVQPIARFVNRIKYQYPSIFGPQ